MNQKNCAYTRKFPTKNLIRKRTSSMNDNPREEKSIPIGIRNLDPKRREIININNFVQLRDEIPNYFRYPNLPILKSKNRDYNNEIISQSQRMNIAKSVDNASKNTNKKLSSLIHSLLNSINKINKHIINSNEDSSEFSNRTIEKNKNNRKNFDYINKSSFSKCNLKLNNDVVLDKIHTRLIKDKKKIEITKIKHKNKNDYNEYNSKTKKIKDKLSENFVSFLKKHKYTSEFIGSKRFEGKSGEYYLASLSNRHNNNILDIGHNFTLANEESSKDGISGVKTIEIELNPKLRQEMNRESILINSELTPIPLKRTFVKNRQEKEEYINAERTAVLIRRIEYSLKLKNKKKYSDDISIKYKIVFIQKWWKRLQQKLILKRKNALIIQKIFRGYLTRKVLYDVFRDFNRFYSFTVKFSEAIQKYVNKLLFLILYKRFAYLSQANYITKQILLIQDHVKIFVLKRKLKMQKFVKNSSKAILIMIKFSYKLIKNHYREKTEVIYVQKMWRGYRLRKTDVNKNKNLFNPLFILYLKHKCSNKYFNIKTYVLKFIKKLNNIVLKPRLMEKIILFYKKINSVMFRYYFHLFSWQNEKLKIFKKNNLKSKNLEKISHIYLKYFLNKNFKKWKIIYKLTKTICIKVKYLYRLAFRYVYWNKFIQNISNILSSNDKLILLFNRIDYCKLNLHFKEMKKIIKAIFTKDNKLASIIKSKESQEKKFYLKKMRNLAYMNKIKDLYLNQMRNGILACEKISKIIKISFRNLIKNKFFLSQFYLLKVNKVVDYYRKTNLIEKMKYYFTKYNKNTKKLSHIIMMTKLRIKNIINLKYANDSFIFKINFKKFSDIVRKLKNKVERKMIDFYRNYQRMQSKNISFYLNLFLNKVRKIEIREKILRKHTIKNDLNNLRKAFIKLDYIWKEENRNKQLTYHKKCRIIIGVLSNLFNNHKSNILEKLFKIPFLISKKITDIIYKITKKSDKLIILKIIRKYSSNVKSCKKFSELKKKILVYLRYLSSKLSFQSEILKKKKFMELRFRTITLKHKNQMYNKALITLKKLYYSNNIDARFKRFVYVKRIIDSREKSILQILKNNKLKQVKPYFVKFANVRKSIFTKIKAISYATSMMQKFIGNLKNQLFSSKFFFHFKISRKIIYILNKFDKSRQFDNYRKQFFKLIKNILKVKIRNNIFKNIICLLNQRAKSNQINIKLKSNFIKYKKQVLNHYNNKLSLKQICRIYRKYNKSIKSTLDHYFTILMKNCNFVRRRREILLYNLIQIKRNSILLNTINFLKNHLKLSSPFLAKDFIFIRIKYIIGLVETLKKLLMNFRFKIIKEQLIMPYQNKLKLNKIFFCERRNNYYKYYAFKRLRYINEFYLNLTKSQKTKNIILKYIFIKQFHAGGKSILHNRFNSFRFKCLGKNLKNKNFERALLIMYKSYFSFNVINRFLKFRENVLHLKKREMSIHKLISCKENKRKEYVIRFLRNCYLSFIKSIRCEQASDILKNLVSSYIKFMFDRIFALPFLIRRMLSTIIKKNSIKFYCLIMSFWLRKYKFNIISINNQEKLKKKISRSLRILFYKIDFFNKSFLTKKFNQFKIRLIKLYFRNYFLSKSLSKIIKLFLFNILRKRFHYYVYKMKRLSFRDSKIKYILIALSKNFLKRNFQIFIKNDFIDTGIFQDLHNIHSTISQRNYKRTNNSVRDNQFFYKKIKNLVDKKYNKDMLMKLRRFFVLKRKNNEILKERKFKILSKLKIYLESKFFTITDKFFKRFHQLISQKAETLITKKIYKTNLLFSRLITDYIDRKYVDLKLIFILGLRKRYLLNNFFKILLNQEIILIKYSWQIINLFIKNKFLENFTNKRKHYLLKYLIGKCIQSNHLFLYVYFTKLKRININFRIKEKLLKLHFSRINFNFRQHLLSLYLYKLKIVNYRQRNRELKIKLLFLKNERNLVNFYFSSLYKITKNRKLRFNFKNFIKGYEYLNTLFNQIYLENAIYNLFTAYKSIKLLNNFFDRHEIKIIYEKKLLLFHKLLQQNANKKDLSLPILINKIINLKSLCHFKIIFEKLNKNSDNFNHFKKIGLFKILYKIDINKRLKHHYIKKWINVKIFKKTKIVRKFIHSLNSNLTKFYQILFSKVNRYILDKYMEFIEKINKKAILKSGFTKQKKVETLISKKHFSILSILSNYFKNWNNSIQKTQLYKSIYLIQQKCKKYQKMMELNNLYLEKQFLNNNHKSFLRKLYEFKEKDRNYMINYYFTKLRRNIKLYSIWNLIVKLQILFRKRKFTKKIKKINWEKFRFKLFILEIKSKNLLAELNNLKRIFLNLRVLLDFSNKRKSKLFSILLSYINKIEKSYYLISMFEIIRKKCNKIYREDYFHRLIQIYNESKVKFIQLYWNTRRKLIKSRRIQEILYTSIFVINISKLKILKYRFLYWLKEVQLYKLSKSITIINKYVYDYLIRKRVKKLFLEYSDFLPFKVAISFIEFTRQIYKK